MANTCANYLQVVAKNTLKNQVNFGTRMPRFGCHCRIMGAHLKQTRFQFPLHLEARFLIIL